MTTSTHTLAPRLLAGFGTLTLLAGIGLFASRPAHTAGGPIPVTIANTPLATTNLDNPAKQPFQTEVQFFQGTGGNFPEFGSFTVPAGKELVIQSVASLAFAPGSTRAFLKMTTTAGGTQVAHYVGILSPIYGSNFLLPLTSIPLHADPNSTVSVTVQRTVLPPDDTGYYDDITISGYLVDVP